MNPADLSLLERILAPQNAPELSPYERGAFAGMLADLKSGERATLSRKQRKFAEDTDARLKPIDAATVAKGKSVETPACLRRENLPMRPPGGRAYVPR
jgi:hypothetical protein